MTGSLHKYQVVILWPNPELKGDYGKGSGILISKDIVLTCAHNFYIPLIPETSRSGTQITKDIVDVYVAPSGSLGDPCDVEKIYIPQEYYKSR